MKRYNWGFDTLAHLLCPRGLEPLLELLLAGVNVKVYVSELDLELPNGQTLVSRDDLNGPLLFGWCEDCGGARPDLS